MVGGKDARDGPSGPRTRTRKVDVYIVPAVTETFFVTPRAKFVPETARLTAYWP